MHLVLVNQYYPPDEAPTGLMLAAVARALVADGHRVTVICAAGGYAGGTMMAEPAPSRQPGPPTGPGLTVIRIGATRFGRGTFVGKLADYASFYAGVGWKLLTMVPRPGRVVALTTPPYLSVLARILSKTRGADHAHWVMDLYPDVMTAHGMLHEGGVPWRLLAGLARFGFGGKRAAAVVTLGPDMAERVTRHLDGGRAAEWVPLWGTEAESRDLRIAGGGDASEEAGRGLRAARGWAPDDLVVMYSGNMGLGHSFDEILAAARALADDKHRPRKIRFVFFGGGKRRPEIEEFARRFPAAGIELRDYVPAADLAAHLRSADVHLVTLRPEWIGTMLPSKLQGIFAAGRPAIFIGDREASIGRWIGESGAGWQVNPGDPAALAAAIGEAADPERRRRMGDAARAYHARCFERPANARRLATIFGRTLS